MLRRVWLLAERVPRCGAQQVLRGIWGKHRRPMVLDSQIWARVSETSDIIDPNCPRDSDAVHRGACRVWLREQAVQGPGAKHLALGHSKCRSSTVHHSQTSEMSKRGDGVDPICLSSQFVFSTLGSLKVDTLTPEYPAVHSPVLVFWISDPVSLRYVAQWSLLS